MKYSPLALALATTLSVSASSSLTTQDEQRYIVKFKNANIMQSQQAIQTANGTIKRNLPKHQLIAAELTAAAVKSLRARSDVEYVEKDPKRHLLAESQPFGIGMVEADQVSDALTGNMTVCITDTGYALGHEDLPSSGVTGDDGHGAYDTGNWYEDGHGHGTHVSGTIAAIGNNGTGVVGVNPSGLVKLHMVKVFNNAGSWAYGSDMVAAVDQCAAAGANVISMSLGGGAPSNAEQAAFDNAAANGILSIAAAGNDGNSTLSYPASYDSVMSVAAVDSNANVASFSQFNSQVEIAAPGVAVNSTLPGNTYAAWSGTSMATPHVAGVAALVWSHYPNCTAAQMRQAINKSAQDRGATGRDNYYGHGIVKAKAMFDMLANGCDVGPIDPPPPPPPPASLTKGVPETNLSGATGEELMYQMEVPAGATDLSFNMSGGSGDADLYVRFGSLPDSTSYDCRPYTAGNNETCSFATPQTGTYYVMVRGYSSFSGVDLVGDYTDDSNPPPPPPADITLSLTTKLKRSTGIVNLSWDGATSSNVDIFRNGSKLKTTANDGAYRDRIRGASGNYVYKVCNESSNDCSNEMTASF
ncbi:S8 family serine peptidase [Aliikangiella sp. IMCC44653]